MSLRIMCTDCSSSSARADSPLSASRQKYPRASPTVAQSLRILCSSSTIEQTNAKIFFTSGVIHSAFPKVFETTSISCWTRKGFSTQGAPVSRKCRDGFFVGNISGNENETRGKIRAVTGDPGMNLSAVDAAGSAHVGHHAKERSTLEQARERRRRIRSTRLDTRYAPARLARRP